MKKLLIVLPATVVGGAELLTKSLVLELCESDIVVLTQKSIAAMFSDTSAKVVTFDTYGLDAPYDYSPRNAWRYALVLAKIVSHEHPNSVLAVMHAASVFLAVATIIYPFQFSRARRVGSIHGNVGGFFHMLGRKPNFLERQYLNVMFSCLHRVVLPSHGILEDLSSIIPDCQRKAVVIHNGVDLERIRQLAAKAPVQANDEPLIVMLARLSPQKDHPTLLRAFAAISQETRARLVLVGDGEKRQALEGLTLSLGIKARVTFTGQLSNPYGWLAAAHVAVLSSHFEGFGLVIVEAMALGSCVIATDCPSGPSEIVRDGVDGFLVAPQDIDGLAERLLQVLQDGDLRKRVRNEGAKRAADFSTAACGARYQEVLGL